MNTILYPVNALKDGGAEQQLLELVRGLDKKRFHPIVAPLYAGGVKDREFREVPGAEVVNLNRRGKYDPSPLWKIARLLRERRVDVIQPFLSPSTFFGLLPAVLLGTPVKIMTERCGVRRSTRVGYRAYQTLEDHLSRFADVIVPNSLAGRDLLIQRGIPEHKIRVIYNGINVARLRPDPDNVATIRRIAGVPDGGRLVGVLARLVPGKGHRFFLQAAGMLSQRRPETRFVVVGDGPLRPELETLAADLRLTAVVQFVGYQSAVADFLAACDIIVSPSVDLEGCSNSILEAMVMAKTVIATDIGGTRELIHDGITGYLVSAGRADALAEAIELALAHPAEASAVGAQARHDASRRFGLERMVDDYTALYAQSLRGQQRRGRSRRESGIEPTIS